MKKLWILWFGLAAAAGAAGPHVPSDSEAAGLRQLLTIHRVYVDRLTGGETAAQMRDVLISSLAGAGMFVVTENQERADAMHARRGRRPGLHRGAHLVRRHQCACQRG